ncbi:MAG: hypothetical protein KAY82_03270 [Hylemonella sp.]|nr:hypothetical protein [Hylemonella sp.]
MSITPKTLSAIQQAGEAIDAARHILADAVTDHASRVMSAIKHNPTGADNEIALEAWKALTQLAREVETVEQQFRNIYFTAEKMVIQEVQVLPALGHQEASPKALPATNISQVEDVIAKPSKMRRKTLTSTHKLAPAADLSTSITSKLSKNDQKVLDHLSKVLSRSNWTRTTLHSVALGAGIPHGSSSAAMNRLLAAKRIDVDAKGLYRLA